MVLIFFSDCIKSLNIDSMKTSSEKFEYELAFNLMLYEDIKVIIYSSSLGYGKRQEKSNIELIGIGGNTKRATFKNFRKLIIENKSTDKIVIFYGYDLVKVVNLLYIKRKYRFDMLSFIFDTHIGSIENFSYLKKFISNIYFKSSIKLLRFLDGYILFQSCAADELNLRKPYYVTKPGINKSSISSYIYDKQTSNFVITYMGSLMPYNGINEILNTFVMHKDIDLRLKIFGSGKLQEKVIDYSKKDKRIYYGGLVDQKMLKNELKDTDLLLNLRDPEHYVCKFAYPSKLIEYMATGIPILSTNLNFDDEMQDCLYVLDRLDSTEIYRKIEYIKNDNIRNKIIKAKKAKEYVANNNNWERICEDLIAFISRLR